VLVRDIMTTDVQRVDRSTTLAAAVERMLRNETDHVVVMEDDTPTALVTRRKALLAAFKTGDPLADIPLSGFGRGFDRIGRPDRTVLLSVGELKRAGADCLPILEDTNVVGVLTRRDVLENVSNITSETLAADREGRDWASGT
jgi:CBS domain-containing protein